MGFIFIKLKRFPSNVLVNFIFSFAKALHNRVLDIHIFPNAEPSFYKDLPNTEGQIFGMMSIVTNYSFPSFKEII